MENNNTNTPAGYKSSELGVIPEGWQVKRLGELGEVVSGLTYSPDDIRDNGILVLRSSNIQNGQLCFDDNVYVEVESYNPVIEDDILICVRNGSRNLIGKNTLITKHIAGTAFGAFMSVFRSPYNKYLFQLFDTDYFYKSVHQNLGATINSINGSDLQDFRFPIPSIEEQERIAEILGTCDRAIELQGRKVALLQSRKRALMQQLLTPHRRLPNFSEPWKTTKLGEIAERVTRKNTENNLNVMTISAQRGFVSQTDFFNKSIASEITDNYFLVHKDEFCYNKSYCNGYPMGAIKRLNSAEKAVVTTLYICFRIKCDKCNIEFLEQYFEAGLLNKNLMKIANEGGRAHGLLNVTPSDFFAMSFEIPSLDEQQAIAEVLTTADREIELATQNLTTLRSQKRALMQQLLTGKKRLQLQ